MEETLEFLTFVGVPASGKSTLADKYRKMGYIILSSDERRAEIEEKINSGELTLPDNTNLNATVFESLKQDASTFLKEGKSVVFDATNLGRRRRMNFRKSLYKIKCKKTCVLFITTVDNCYERNSKREGYARVPDEAMYKMFCNKKDGIAFYLFNKKSTQQRVNEVRAMLRAFNWTPSFNNWYDIKGDKEWWAFCFPQLKNVENNVAWSKMPKDMLDYIKSLPEFNEKVWKEITK